MKTAEDYIREYKGWDFTAEKAIEMIKEVQQDIIRETVKRCAESADIKLTFSNGKYVTHSNFSKSGDIFTIDKDSILKVEPEMIKGIRAMKEDIEKALEKSEREFYGVKVTNNSDYAGYKSTFSFGFKAGVNWMDQQYKQKTRWIPIEEKLPPLNEHLLLKYPEWYQAEFFENEPNRNYWLLEGVKPTHWKKIEP